MESQAITQEMTKLKPVAEAQQSIFSMMARAKTESRALDAAHGRVLATDITAQTDHPAADISAMDGYALASAGKILAKGTCFELAGEAAAGHYTAASIGNKQAMRIFTGAYLPDGADSVAIQEDVSRDGEQICLNEPVKTGQFVRPKGLDFSAGEVILQAGTILGARQLALAGLAGYSALPVRKKPLVAIISSGDELVSVGQMPQAGQLINSNSVFLAHALRQAGAEVADLGIIPDKKGALISALQEGLATYKHFDLIVCTGGASVGQHDHIAADLNADQNASIDFWRIAMRPGKPLIAARWRDIPFLGLPGNPVSAGVCSLVFVLPAIQMFLGLPVMQETRTLPLAVDMPENDRRQDYIRAVYTRRPDGSLAVHPLGKQDSSMLRNFCQAELLILRPPFAKPAKAGDMVSVMDIAASL